MNKYIFKVNIYPNRLKFHMIGESHFHLDDGDIEGEGKTIIKESQMYIEFISEKDYSKELDTLKNSIEEVARTYIDIYCYIKSCSYDIDIENVICPELNIGYSFGIKGELNIDKNIRETQEELNKITTIFKEPKFSFLMYSFADFRRSIKYPLMTAGFCYRAIETIRKFYFEDPSIKKENKRRKQGWIKLGSSLNYDQNDFDEIIKFATPNRHGDYPKITYQEREKIMNFTREFIDKFIDFILKNTT